MNLVNASVELIPVFNCNFDTGTTYPQVCEGSTGTTIPTFNGPTFGLVNSDSLPTYTNPSWFVSDFTSICM